MSDFFSTLPKDEQASLETPVGLTSKAEEPIHRYRTQLLDIPGVEGFAPKDDHFVVYVLDQEVLSRLPSTIGGIPVVPVVTGEIRALTSG